MSANYMKSLNELCNQVAYQIVRFDQKRESCRIKYHIIFGGQTILTIVTTVCLGLSFNDSNFMAIMKNVALVTSTVASGLATFQSNLKYKEQWTYFTLVSGRLKAFRSNLNLIRKNIEDDESGTLFGLEECDRYFIQFQKILSESNSEWQLLLKSDDRKQEKPVNESLKK
ncbi:SLATT domain-containing protein [Candidatus Magnetaquicoccus inordinatus]|uniref:SLATT domain-containing protein n=1 Tax=Candidatus Magnetaquicoccus inordinatus TaxID=2496818 RepID=UPI00102C02E1|nr:SLATT domain-containing protein [Candidatus Magnetaquicoccus inordinatus]